MYLICGYCKCIVDLSSTGEELKSSNMTYGLGKTKLTKNHSFSTSSHNLLLEVVVLCLGRWVLRLKLTLD